MSLEHIDILAKGFIGYATAMLVQSSAVILLVLLVDFALRKRVKAVVRYWLWMVVPLQLLLPVFLPFLADWGHRLSQAQYAASAANAGPVGAYAVVSWQAIILMVWVVAAAAMVVFWLHRAILARQIVASAREAKNMMKGTMWYCRTCLKVKSEVGLKVTAKAASPVLYGLRRPVILIPHHLAPSLGSRHLRSMLLHQVAHIKRGDIWVNLLQSALQIVYFYNPLLWLANCRIRSIRDEAVDEQVVAIMGDKAQWYSDALQNVGRLSHGRPALSLRMVGVAESRRTVAAGARIRPGVAQRVSSGASV